jgi:hypothetical protein
MPPCCDPAGRFLPPRRAIEWLSEPNTGPTVGPGPPGALEQTGHLAAPPARARDEVGREVRGYNASMQHSTGADDPTPARQVYIERPPVPALAGLVSSIWIQQVAADADPYTHRNIPHGGVELACQVGSVPRIVGPLTRPLVKVLAPGTTVVGLRFRPGAGRARRRGRLRRSVPPDPRVPAADRRDPAGVPPSDGGVLRMRPRSRGLVHADAALATAPCTTLNTGLRHRGASRDMAGLFKRPRRPRPYRRARVRLTAVDTP